MPYLRLAPPLLTAPMESKGLPAAVQRFAHAGDHAHLDHLARASSSSGSTSFRTDASSTPKHAESAFAAFTGGANGQTALERDGRSELVAESTRNASHDGFEINALLAGNGLVTDAVDGDWERELMEEQARPWRVEMETTMPTDPFASPAAASASRSARLDAHEGKGKEKARAGDMSPTSEELLSSLSSLDLADKAYLRSLLSLSPDDAFQDYLARSSYADDVYGLPQGVKRLFEKAAREEEGVHGEEGRTKALRRLDMVLQHLRAAEGGGEMGTVSEAAMEGVSVPRSPAPLPPSHFAHPTATANPSFTLPTPEKSTTRHSPSPHSSPPRHSHYSVPSSLSESAFITIAGSQPRQHRTPSAPIAPTPLGAGPGAAIGSNGLAGREGAQRPALDVREGRTH